MEAKIKYGEKLLRTRAYDELGENQLDSGNFQLVKAENRTSHSKAAEDYVECLFAPDKISTFFRIYEDYSVLTAGGLY